MADMVKAVQSGDMTKALEDAKAIGSTVGADAKTEVHALTAPPAEQAEAK